MSNYLQLFVVVPLLGFLASLFVSRKNEIVLSSLAWAVVGTQLIGTLIFVGIWAMNGFQILDIKEAVLYKNADFEFFIDFYFDKTTAVFALVGAILVFLVSIFSRYYMHRDEGFKRFFSTLLLFFAGYNLIIFAGNFETLFVGWELLGICSFLLIAFYRDRYLPVKNGFKVISFYRISDICLIVAMWMSHHLWHKNITFLEWQNPDFLLEPLTHHSSLALIMAILIVVAAAIKSAQMPFSTWLPRAMEGPTTSSAIFYGSLSVHIGIFMLLRSFPLWENEPAIKGLIIATGLATSLIATAIARVQPTVKTQIAYASITQIGLMFVEIGLGWHTLALVHFAANAFLRTYQLLVSPSVLSYLTHDMFFNYQPQKAENNTGFLLKMKQTIFLLSIKEWHFDGILFRYLWSPAKWLGNKLGFMAQNGGLAATFGILLLSGFYFFTKPTTVFTLKEYAPLLLALVALSLILKAFTERGDALRTWLILFISQFFVALAILYNSVVEWQQIIWYLSGTIAAFAVGYLSLNAIKSIDNDINLDKYHGYSYEKPTTALIFLLSGLGLLGFPITPTFIGIDLMFTHIQAHQVTLIVVMALNFLFLELSILRIYTRVFLGQHKKMYHPIAFKSS